MTKDKNDSNDDLDVGEGANPSPAAETPETLAPQVMPPEDLDADDLAVLPGQGKPLLSSTRLGRIAVAAAVLLVGGYLFTKFERGESAPASASVSEPPEATRDLPVPASPKAPSKVSEATPEVADEADGAPGFRGIWTSPAGDDGEQPLDEDWGPNTKRFPDLPRETLSFLKQIEAAEKQKGNLPASSPATPIAEAPASERPPPPVAPVAAPPAPPAPVAPAAPYIAPVAPYTAPVAPAYQP